jgi:hypothetical protein
MPDPLDPVLDPMPDPLDPLDPLDPVPDPEPDPSFGIQLDPDPPVLLFFFVNSL